MLTNRKGNIINAKWLLIAIFLFINKDLSATNTTLPDSIVTIEHTYLYAISDPAKAQQIMEELLRRQTYKAWELDWCQGDLYYNTGKYRLALYYFERVATYQEVSGNPELMMGLLSTMMECYRMNNNMDMTMQTAIRLQKSAEANNNKAEIGRAYQFMGITAHDQKDSKRSDEFFALALKYLEESGSLEYIYHFHLTIANMFTQDKRYEEAYAHVTTAISTLDKITEKTNPLQDGQMAYERGRLCALAPEIASKTGREMEALHHFEVFSSSPCASDERGQIYIVPYLLDTQEYAQAIEITQKRIGILENQTDAEGDDMLAALSYLQEAYEGRGERDNALAVAKRCISLHKTIRENDLKNSALELSIIYDVQQKESLISRQESELEKHKILSILSLIVIAASLIVISLIIHKMRFTKRANRSMVAQIKEIQQYKSTIDKLKNGSANEKEETIDCGNDIDAPADECPEVKQLFLMIDKKIREEKLFLNPQFTRDDAVQLFNIKRNDLIHAVNQQTGMNFTDYINNIRMEVALDLLENTTDNIEIVAENSGFGSARSLYRRFSQKYNMSPTAYRKLQGNVHPFEKITSSL